MNMNEEIRRIKKDANEVYENLWEISDSEMERYLKKLEMMKKIIENIVEIHDFLRENKLRILKTQKRSVK